MINKALISNIVESSIGRYLWKEDDEGNQYYIKYRRVKSSDISRYNNKVMLLAAPIVKDLDVAKYKNANTENLEASNVDDLAKAFEKLGSRLNDVEQEKMHNYMSAMIVGSVIGLEQQCDGAVVGESELRFCSQIDQEDCDKGIIHTSTLTLQHFDALFEQIYRFSAGGEASLAEFFRLLRQGFNFNNR